MSLCCWAAGGAAGAAAAGAGSVVNLGVVGRGSKRLRLAPAAPPASAGAGARAQALHVCRGCKQAR